jgi:hypothetical protein
MFYCLAVNFWASLSQFREGCFTPRYLLSVRIPPDHENDDDDEDDSKCSQRNKVSRARMLPNPPRRRGRPSSSAVLWVAGVKDRGLLPVSRMTLMTLTTSYRFRFRR